MVGKFLLALPLPKVLLKILEVNRVSSYQALVNKITCITKKKFQFKEGVLLGKEHIVSVRALYYLDHHLKQQEE